jgi:hypothetical protein
MPHLSLHDQRTRKRIPEGITRIIHLSCQLCDLLLAKDYMSDTPISDYKETLQLLSTDSALRPNTDLLLLILDEKRRTREQEVDLNCENRTIVVLQEALASGELDK